VPTSTLHAWVGQFASVCTFTRLRKRFSLSPDEAIQSKTFDHKQEYKFAFHRLKTNLLCKRRFPQMRRYLWDILENCPNNLFQRSDGARCSDGNLPHLTLRLVRKETNAQALAKLGLLLAKRSKERHQAIQHFMLVNDSATIAVEVPVYLHPHEAPDLQLTGVLTGHIDVLQIRGNRVWILDYKPDAKREKRAKYQIYLYARALSARTGIPLSRFGLAYFDDKDYFEVTIESSKEQRLAALAPTTPDTSHALLSTRRYPASPGSTGRAADRDEQLKTGSDSGRVIQRMSWWQRLSGDKTTQQKIAVGSTIFSSQSFL